MPSPRQCATCRAVLPDGTPDGQCPECLLQFGLEAGTGYFPPLPAQPGGILCRYFGDYELLEEIARGGMGVVFRARQVSLNRIVAVKMILAGHFAGKDSMARFHKEAESAASLRHPNIVSIHEIGEHEGQQYFSMDYIAGRNLAEVVRENPLSAKRAAECVRTMAEAIHYAHERGVLHRDLKPANVLLDAEGRPHITDFGLAKIVERKSELRTGSRASPASSVPQLSTQDPLNSLTLTGQVLGSPGYMPPEQAAGRRDAIGPAGDIYSLGAILYHLLTGRPSFAAETFTETLRQVAEQEPVSPRLLNPTVPRDMETICLKCLEKTPSRRYLTAQELADELGRYLHDEPIFARPIGPAVRLWRWCRRKPLVSGLAAGIVLLVLASAAGSLMAAFRINRQRERADAETIHARQSELQSRQSEQQAHASLLQAETNLWTSYLAQAQARRWSGRPGRRFESLEALKKAAAIRPSIELRNEAIACLALSDLQVVKEWNSVPTDGYPVGLDAKYERYVFGDAQGIVHVRRVQDEAELMQFPGFEPPFQRNGFSPDGRLLFVACGQKANRAEIFDLDRKEVILRLPDVPFRAMCFSADSRLLAISYNRQKEHFPVRVFDLAQRKELASFSHVSLPFSIHFHPKDPDRLLTSDKSPVVRVWHWKTGKEIQHFTHPNWVQGIDWHPDGEMVATACADRNVRLWDAATGRQRSVMTGHESQVVEVTFSHDGAFLASHGWDGTLRLWEPMSGRMLLNKAIPGSIHRFNLSRLQLGYATAPGRFGLFEVVPGLGCRLLRPNEDEDLSTTTCAFSRDSRLLVSNYKEHVRFWDINGGREVAFCSSLCLDAMFQPGGPQLFARKPGGGVQEWLVQSSVDGGMITLQSTRQFAINPAEFSLNRAGTLLGKTPSGRAFELLDLQSGEVRLRIGGFQNAALATLSPDGKFMAAWPRGAAGQLEIGDLTRTQIVARVPMRNGANALFSPNDRWLATGDNTEYCLWERDTWKPIYTVPREFTDYWAKLAFTEDSSMLAVAYSRNAVRLLDAATGRQLATLEAPEPQNIEWLAFSPDGTQLAAASTHGPIQHWNLRSIREQLAVMKLDWELPPYPPAPANAPSGLISVTVRDGTNTPPHPRIEGQ